VVREPCGAGCALLARRRALFAYVVQGRHIGRPVVTVLCYDPIRTESEHQRLARCVLLRSPPLAPMTHPYEAFLDSILDGDRRRARDCARQVFEQHGVVFLYEKVVQPALHEVGERWFASRITVADEHLATATAQSAVAALYPLFRWPPRGPRAIVACAQGEHHDFGARMVADLLALDGWDERFLGADVPVEDLVRKVREIGPKMVAISVTLSHHLRMAETAIRLVRGALPAAKILIGGRAMVAPGVYESLGADGVARSGSEAVEVARGWK